jgi:hypothetical protein
MQMGRWFGYREGYSDLCKIFMPVEIETNFRDIITSTEELFEDFRDLAKSNKTPYDFGLAVKQDPNSALQITARNKLKNIKTFNYEMKFDGRLKETVKFNSDKKAIEQNFNLGIKLITQILESNQFQHVGSTYFWADISKSIVINFLNEYVEVNTKDPLGIISKMPLAFIRDSVSKRDCLWDVALISGEGVPLENTYFNERIYYKQVVRNMVYKKEDNCYHYPKNQLSIPRDESIPLLAKGEDLTGIGNDRKKMRKLRSKPLLLLYFIQSDIPEPIGRINKITGFAVSFDGDIETNTQVVKMAVNTVFYKNLIDNLIEEIEEENE